jgi:predicted O-methyltransferase YrrM
MDIDNRKRIFQSNWLLYPEESWYCGLLANTSTITNWLFEPTVLSRYCDLLNRLEKDSYTRYLLAFMEAGQHRFGSNWRYADIGTLLLALASNMKIKDYLEIGVRAGRSLAMVAHTCPYTHIVGFDLWPDHYAGMKNPGPAFVENEVKKIGYTGNLQLIPGDSHETVPEFFRHHPDAYFDCITVDGDHSEQGAKQDLETVIPRLRAGGVLVFDDIVHPKHRYLKEVWRTTIAEREDFQSYEFTELGYGVAFAVRLNEPD